MFKKNYKYCDSLNCDCTENCGGINQKCSCFEPEYAFFSQNGILFNTALFGGIRFENNSINTNGIVYDTSIITIFNPGVYLANYFVLIPSTVTVNTNFALQFNNQDLIGSTSRVNKTATDTPYSAVGQAIFRVTQISSIRLSSSRIININAENQSDTAASLTIIKIAE